MRAMLKAASSKPPQGVQEQDGPIATFHFGAELGKAFNHAALNALTDLGIEAAATAQLALGAADHIRRSEKENKLVAVASNKR